MTRTFCLHTICGLLLLLPPGAALAWDPPAGTPATPPSRLPPGASRKTNRLVHVTSAADLSTARVARVIGDRVRQARAARADTFVLELTGDRWRADVVHGIAAAFREAGVRTVVWLRDTDDQRVGAGQAALAMIADECWIAPQTRVVRRSRDNDAALAPKGADLGAREEELLRWCAQAAHDRGVDALLPRALLGPPDPLWAVDEFGDASFRLTPVPPKSGASAPFRVVPLRPGEASSEDGELVSIPADLALALHLATGIADSLPDIFSARHVHPSAQRATPAGAELPSILARAAEAVAALDAELEGIDRDLDAKPRDKRVNTRQFYGELTDRVLARAAVARSRVLACERMLEEDPEITRTAPPGMAGVGVMPDAWAAKWRQVFQKRRDAITRFEKKARALTGG
jgi:hypothetical protein